MMEMQKKNKKNKKRRLKPVPVLILTIVIIVMVVSLFFIFGKSVSDESLNIDISATGSNTNKSGLNESDSTKQISVSIDMDSCAIPIGSTLKVTASVDPVETVKTINWSSSDEKVFTVDSEGIITIKGKGTSALTATIGSSSDAIVIEGISNDDSAKSQNDLPIFNLITNGATSNGVSSNGTSVGGTSSGGISSNGTSSGGTSSTGTSNDTTSNNTTNSAGNTVDNVDSSNPVSPSNSNNSGNNNVSNAGNSSNPVNTNNQTTIGLKSTDLNTSLSQIGYSQMLSNVYVYQENNTYYGEIVIQTNVTIIYIKQRNEGYDAKIKEVIAKLLPKENAQVWSNFLSATSDRTFTVEGRVVRIVTALNGGHSQIVIYN